MQPALYVGDLHPDVTETMLFEKFSTIGPVQTIRVCRNLQNRRSLCYGYVNYLNYQDCMRALEELNYETLHDRPMRIMWSNRNPALRQSNVGNVFIKNLHSSIGNHELHDTFKIFGNILSCKVEQDGNGESLEYGFVHFETEESAKNAIDNVNGMMLNDKQVYVGKFIPKTLREKQNDGLKTCNNVFVKNFGNLLDESQLKSMFAKFGEISSVKVMRSANGESMGFGFVTYKEKKDASVAVNAMNGYALEDGTILYAGAAEKKSVRNTQLQADHMYKQQPFNLVNLYVKHLSCTMSENDLRELFEEFGTVTSTKLMMNGPVSKGFGFVSMSTPDEATRAITELNGRIVNDKPLYVALAQKKEVRKRNLEMHFKAYAVNERETIAGNNYSGSVTGGFFLPSVATPQNYFGETAINMVRNIPQWATRIPNTTHNINNSQITSNIPQYQQTMPNQIISNSMQPPYQQTHLTSRPIVSTNYQQNLSTSNQPNQIHTNHQISSPNHQYIVSNAAQNYPNPNMYPPSHYSALPPTQYVVQHPHHKPLRAVPPQPSNPTPDDPLANLADASPEEQRVILGERLYVKVAKTEEPSLAAKITGMLLEIDTAELLHTIDSPKLLQARIEEAKETLHHSQQNTLVSK